MTSPETVSVAFDYQIFDLQRFGGISRYVVELARGLARMPGCEVAVVAPFHMNEYLRSLEAPVRTQGWYVGGIPRSRRVWRLLNGLVGPQLVRRARPQVVHRTYYAPGQPRLPDARSVITVHDLIYERMGLSTPNDLLARHMRAAVAEAQHAICISESTQRDLIELFGVPPERTSVVYHGFSMGKVKPGPTLSLPARPYLLYVGLRRKYKNFQGLLDAYRVSARLREEFDIVCFGGGPFDADEAAAISATGARAGSVVQIGGGDGALQQAYRRAAVFVYPSLYEGFGIPPLEAMSFDCPVVCCPVASMPEVVGDAAAFFEAGNAESLAHAIERVVADAPWRSCLVERGRRRLGLFSWERCARETLAVYRGLFA